MGNNNVVLKVEIDDILGRLSHPPLLEDLTVVPSQLVRVRCNERLRWNAYTHTPSPSNRLLGALAVVGDDNCLHLRRVGIEIVEGSDKVGNAGL